MNEDIVKKERIKNYLVPVGDSYKVSHSKLLAFTIVVSFVLLSLIYFVVGWSAYFVLDLLLWLFFYRYSRHVVVKETFEFARTAFVFFLTFLFSVAIFGFSAPKTFDTVRGNLYAYNNKVLSIKSADNKAVGSIGLKARLDEKTGHEYIEAYYNILISENLKPNGNCGPKSALFGCDKNISYEYAGDFIAANEGAGIAEGALLPVYCNKSKLPKDPFGEIPREHSIQNCEVADLGSETATFLIQFIKSYAAYGEIFESNKIDIYDGSYFWEKLDERNSTSAVDMIMNLDKAVAKGWKVASYDLVIEE